MKYDRNEWIGVDFDGTLAEYHGWVGWNVLGKPVPAMISRVGQWLRQDKRVRIFTARIRVFRDNDTWCRRDRHCLVTDELFSDYDMENAIQTYTLEYFGVRLPVTCVKDLHMVELWDDRAVQVMANTGRTVIEERDAEYWARHGRSWNAEDLFDGK